MLHSSVRIQEVLDFLGATHRVHQEIARRTQSLLGLNLERATLLLRVGEGGGEMTVSELAERLFRTSQSVSALVRAMEVEGLVTRRRDNMSDRRLVIVAWTSSGRAQVDGFQGLFTGIIGDVFANPLDANAVRRVRQAMVIIKEQLVI